MKRVLVVGELNVDLVLQGLDRLPALGMEILAQDFQLVLGSASAIFAMGLAQLGRPVSFLGKVGDDAWGSLCLQALRSRRIDISQVEVKPDLKTGLTVAFSTAKDRAMVSYIGSIDANTIDDVSDEVMNSADHLHVSSFYLQRRLRSHCRDLFAKARRLGLTTSLDPGCDPLDRWGSDLIEVLPEVDVFLPNEVELERLSGKSHVKEALAQFDNGRTCIVAKLGARGATARFQGKTTPTPAYKITPVDTTGAGDSFNAGFLHGWLEGWPLEECLRLGSACGALSTRGIGGTATQATLDDALQFGAITPPRK
ncbi:MAG: carbohydrate kinase family protein [Pirellulales bacterium]|nr:carbohydrate kinase family protein [Pirellulales bacterium]